MIIPVIATAMEPNIDLLTEKTAQLIVKDHSTVMPPLHDAIIKKNYDKIKKIISEIPDKNMQSTILNERWQGITPLARACMIPEINGACIQYLLNCGAKINKSTKITVENLLIDYIAPIHCAAMNGNAKVVNILLKNNANQLKIDGDLQNALSYAIINNHYDVIKILIDNLVQKHRIADPYSFLVEDADKYDWNIYDLARCSMRNKNIIALLLTILDKEGHNFLYSAIMHGNWQLVQNHYNKEEIIKFIRMLFPYKIRINDLPWIRSIIDYLPHLIETHMFNDALPIEYAIKKSKYEIIDLLKKNGKTLEGYLLELLEVQIKEDFCLSLMKKDILMAALLIDYIETLQIPINPNNFFLIIALKNADKFTPIELIFFLKKIINAHMYDTNSIKILIKKAVNRESILLLTFINDTIKDNDVLLFNELRDLFIIPDEYYNEEKVKFLVTYCADHLKADGFQIVKELCQFYANSSRNINKIELLLNHGVDVNMTDERGNTMLHLLCDQSQINYELIEFILRRGVWVDHQNANGETALHYACKLKQDKLINLLITKWHAKTSLRNRNWVSPIYYHQEYFKKKQNTVCTLI